MKTTFRITTAAALAVLTGSAFGMQPASESGRERPARDRTVLRGPDDAGRPDRGDRPADRPGRNAEAARPAGEPGFQMIAMALRGLQRSDDETLRLTDDQTAQIRAITAEHREAMQQFVEEHKDEIAKIRAVAGEDRPARFGQRPDAAPAEDGADRPQRPNARRAGDRPQRPADAPGMDDEMGDAPAPQGEFTPEQRAEAREKLRAMMEAAPHEKEAKKKLMAVLTEPQQARVKEIIEAQAERVRERAQGDRPGVRPQRDARPTEVAPDAAPADRARPGDRPVRRQRPGADG